MPETIVRLLEQGAEANYRDRFRRGNVVHLPAEGSLLATGDLHGHRRNFERIVTAADLENRPDRHVVLQEIIHGGPENAQGGCLSYQLLFDVVRYKLGFGDRVHILMGNHDTAFMNDSAVVKNGKEMNQSMRLALDREFQQDSERIKTVIAQYLLSQPLAVRCPNRIWLSHSLPGNAYADAFDKQVLDRRLRTKDLVRPGSAYLLTWGRNHSQETLDKMARILDVDCFILGHQRQEQGWCRAGDNLIILGSDHNHGCLLPIDLKRTYTIEELVDLIVPLTSIA
jgi:predicted phosphodiesterase